MAEKTAPIGEDVTHVKFVVKIEGIPPGAPRPPMSKVGEWIFACLWTEAWKAAETRLYSELRREYAAACQGAGEAVAHQNAVEIMNELYNKIWQRTWDVFNETIWGKLKDGLVGNWDELINPLARNVYKLELKAQLPFRSTVAATCAGTVIAVPITFDPDRLLKVSVTYHPNLRGQPLSD